ncbi:hypothetical protein QTP88_015335 [Uroleucon formosanum]
MQDCYTKRKKDISDVSSKYFKQLLKAEQKKFGKCTQRENLNLISTSILPTVSSFNIIDCVKTVLPRSQTTVVDILTHVADCSNIIDQTVASNYCIPYVDNYSKLQVTNDTPLLIENNATQNLNLTDKLRSLILLQISRSEKLDVLKDVRTLMKTPKNQEIVAVSGGSYVHLSIKSINIDGLPLTKSSKSQLWPILISVINFKELPNNVIPVGIFHGFQKTHLITAI